MWCANENIDIGIWPKSGFWQISAKPNIGTTLNDHVTVVHNLFLHIQVGSKVNALDEIYTSNNAPPF